MQIFTDGGSRGNPGKSACAFIVYDGKKEIYSESKYLGINTNNYAEYSGVILALKWAPSNSFIQLFSDSELMVKQLNGIYKIKNLELQKLAIQIKKIISDHNLKINFQNVPREQNKSADELVNVELDKIYLRENQSPSE